MLRRLAAAILTSSALLFATAGGAGAALLPAGWAPGGVPSSPTSVLRDSDVSGAAANCGENAALLVRVGRPQLLRRWSVAIGDALVAKGWSVHDLEEPGTLRGAALQDELSAATRRCGERTVLVASYGMAIAPVRRAVHRLRASGQTRVTTIAEVPAGTRHVAWIRNARPILRGLRTWPTPILDAARAGVPQNGVQLGVPDAPVVIDIFVDMQCPFCRNYELQVLPRLVARYVRAGEVQMRAEIVSFIGVDSLRGAQLVMAAGLQNRLWNAAARFFEREGVENSGYVTDTFLRHVAALAGLDVQRAMTDRGSSLVRSGLKSAQDAWQGAGFAGVPSFLIGPAGGPRHRVGGDYLRPSVIEGTIQRALRAARTERAAAAAG